MSFRAKEESHPRHKESRPTENVLVLQGGGSLGAFACGVFKALVKKKIRIDIVAGTSIGAINAAIVVGSKSDHPEKELEEFWLEIAESNYEIIPDIYLLTMIVIVRDMYQSKYLLLQLMPQYLVFQKCLFQDGGGYSPLDKIYC
jgi:predicted acylesterase/phospholipase RssA